MSRKFASVIFLSATLTIAACNPEDVLVSGTGGSTTVATGGSSGTGGATITPVSTGGTNGTGGATVTPVTVTNVKPLPCPGMVTYGNTYTANGYTFIANWIAQPSADTRAVVVNPVWPFGREGTSACSQFLSRAAMYVYDLSNGSAIVACSVAKPQGLSSAITSEGYRFDMSGQPAGVYHIAVKDANDAAVWGMWGPYFISQRSSVSTSAAQYIEKSQNPAEIDSLGIVFYWTGSTVTVATSSYTNMSTVYGGNWR